MAESKIREARVAGQFYLSTAGGLKKQVESLINKDAKKIDALACMLPHAGYQYSGRVAGETVSRINLRDKIILLGPNHTGFGAPFSIMSEGSWQTPLGEVAIDSALAQKILKNSRFLEDNPVAHTNEHSLEVELPFLQYFKPDFQIIPIAFLSDEIESLKEIGREIARTIQENNLADKVLLLASSDMTHYEPQNTAKNKDKEAIQAILELNEEKLIEKIYRLRISMCGWAPVIVMLTAAKKLGAKAAALVKYQTSGDVTGDNSSVVGYAGIIIYG